MPPNNSTAKLLRELDAILSDEPAAVIDRVRQSVKAVVGDRDKSFVLFGAGALGRKALAALREIDIEPRAFADNDPRKWGQQEDGVEILEPGQATRLHSDNSVFVATVYTHHSLMQQMQEMGVRSITFPALAWLYPSLMPYYALDYPHSIFAESASVRKAFALWSDDLSRREFMGQIRWRTSLEVDALPPPSSPEEIYFPEDLLEWSSSEVLVDCGAFDGDTIREVVRRRGSAFGKIIALEPDPANLARLKAFLETIPGELRDKVEVMNYAAGSSRKSAFLEATGTGSSALGSGAFQVAGAPLDEILRGYAPSFIKMDIEGSEPDALAGARRVIQEYAPILAVCLYHRPVDLWRIPLQIREFTDRYSFHLRRYSDDCWEQVLYAIPQERAVRRA